MKKEYYSYKRLKMKKKNITPVTIKNLKKPEGMSELEFLLKLRRRDPEGFADYIMKSLYRSTEIVFADPAPAETKVRALDKLCRHFEQREQYEDCAFLMNIRREVLDAGK